MTDLLTTQQAADQLRMSRAVFVRNVIGPRLVRTFRRNRRVILVYADSLQAYIQKRSSK